MKLFKLRYPMLSAIMGFTGVLLMVNSPSSAQYGWPAVTPETKPWARWWWPGSAVDKEGLRQNMEAYAAAGLGGLELTPIYGVKGADSAFIPYLNEKWTDHFRYALKESSRLGMQMDMATGTGWPFGGPQVGETDACKNLVIDTMRLAGGKEQQVSLQRLQEGYLRTVSGKKPAFEEMRRAMLQHDSLQAYAVEQLRWPVPLRLMAVTAYGDDGTITDITALVDSKGILRCKVPAGTSWKLYACYMGWHGKWVERAAPGGEGNVIDHFQKAALTRYLAVFDSAFHKEMPAGLRAFFNDSYEVDDGVGQSDWTPFLFDEFSKRRGYDLRLWIRALQQEDTPANNQQVLADYRLTVSELLADEFTATWNYWARKYGKITRSQAHGSPANILDLYAAVDIPEGEGEDVLRLKFASSAAHVSGKRLVGGELATWLGDHFEATLADVQRMANLFFISGVNHLVYHGLCYSPPGEPWPGWLFYAAVHFSPQHPFWKDLAKLNTYITRVQSVLQQGTAKHDILLYFPFPEFIRQNTGGRLKHFDGMKDIETTPFARIADSLQRLGYTFDFISDKQLKQLYCSNGQLQSGSASYKAVLVPPVQRMPAASVNKLEKLAQAGARVIFTSTEKIWSADVHPGKRQHLLISLMNSPGRHAGVINKGKGQWIVDEHWLAALQTAGVTREHLVDHGLQFTRKLLANGTTRYFVVNSSGNNWKGWTRFNTSGHAVLLRDALSGQTGKGKIKQVAGEAISEVYLSLLPGQSIIVDFLPDDPFIARFHFFEALGKGTALPGPWQVRFDNGGPVIPQQETISLLRSWTDFLQKEASWFSGTAVYSIGFPRPAYQSDHFLLDLGRVAESASIRLNGRILDTLIAAPWQVVISADQLQANNMLEITVSNGMQNHIIQLERAGGEWRRFYNINFPARDVKNRGSNGLFTTAGWHPVESGLLGPVQLIPVRTD